MKKDKRILALVLAAAMMGTTALPVWAQTPETADSSVVEVEGTLENIIAAREALAAQAAPVNALAGQQILAEPAPADGADARVRQRWRRMTTTFRRRRPWWSAWPMP